LRKLQLEVTRDRDATFEPKLIPQYQRRLPGFDEKILALDVKGMALRVRGIIHPAGDDQQFVLRSKPRRPVTILRIGSRARGNDSPLTPSLAAIVTGPTLNIR